MSFKFIYFLLLYCNHVMVVIMWAKTHSNSNTTMISTVNLSKQTPAAEPTEPAAPTCRLLHVVVLLVCSGSSRPVAALFRGLTAATAERSAAFLFWPGFTCALGFTTDGLTFSLGLTGKRTRARPR